MMKANIIVFLVLFMFMSMNQLSGQEVTQNDETKSTENLIVPVYGAGAQQNYITKWTDERVPQIGNSLITDDGTTVSIFRLLSGDGNLLEIRGNLFTEGFTFIDKTNPPTNGYVLTSDALGNARWAESTGGVGGTSPWLPSVNGIYYDRQVGIGILNPLYDLHVNGSAYTLDLTVNGNILTKGFNLDDGSHLLAGYVLTCDADGNGSWQEATGGSGTESPWLPNGTSEIYYEGNVGIGTLDPKGKLNIYGDNAKLIISDPSAAETWDDDNLGEIIFRTHYNLWEYTKIYAYGTTSNAWAPDLRFMTNATDRMTITETGYVGIGTTNPDTELEVIGTISTSDLDVATNTTTNYLDVAANTTTNNLIVAGTTTTQNFTLYNSNDPPRRGEILETDEYGIASWVDPPEPGSSPWEPCGTSDIHYNAGSVGIGTTNTGEYKLAVNGKILAELIKVVGDVPASDYVFKEDYKLMSLYELEEFVNKNQHLPEVKSAEEFKEEGYSIGEMDDVLLRKVEELTLYTIEQQKLLDKQQQMVDLLLKQVLELEQKINHNNN